MLGASETLGYISFMTCQLNYFSNIQNPWIADSKGLLIDYPTENITSCFVESTS